MDDEITGMHEIAKVLEDLDEEARARVIRWAAEKFGVDLRLAPSDESGDIEDSDHTRFMGVDPDKLEAAREARAGQVAESRDVAAAPKLEVQPASSLDKPAEAPPERDPEKPSFMDTQFRIFSGKQELKKSKKEDD